MIKPLTCCIVAIGCMLPSCKPRTSESSELAGKGKALKVKFPILMMGRSDFRKTTIDRVVELSGITWNRPDESQVVVVGDKHFSVVGFSLADGSSKHQELGTFVAPFYKNAKKGSQWESVAGDASGMKFVLKESPPRIFVFHFGQTPPLRAVLNLNIPKKTPLFEVSKADPNSIGEGFVLLKNGHILLLKEKGPDMRGKISKDVARLATPLIIEFVPEDKLARGGRPEGYRPGMAVTMRDTFPIRQQTQTGMPMANYLPARIWRIGDNAGEFLRELSPKNRGDLSDMTVDRNGRLYVLSDEGHSVFAVELCLSPDPNKDKFKFEAAWIFPKNIGKLEGLTFNSRNQMFIVSDLAQTGDNLIETKPVTLPGATGCS